MSTKSRWSVDLNLHESDVGHAFLQKKPHPHGYRALQSVERHIEQQRGGSSSRDADGGGGVSSAISAAETKQLASLRARKQSKAMSIAMSPGKQMVMNTFMLWFSGKNLNIFSISITSMTIINPIKGVLSLSDAFRSCEDAEGKVDLSTAKALFVLLNMVWLAIGLYKMGNMNLLPLTSADWNGYVVWKHVMETSSIPPS